MTGFQGGEREAVSSSVECCCCAGDVSCWNVCTVDVASAVVQEGGTLHFMFFIEVCSDLLGTQME